MSNPQQVKSRFKQLLKSDGDAARDYLSKAAYGLKPNTRLQAFYCKEIAKPKAPSKEAAGILKTLASDGSRAHLAMAKKLCRLSTGDWTRERKLWLTDPRNISIVVNRLASSPEPVQHQLVFALGMISQRYDYLDSRIRDALMSLFDEASPKLQIVIAGAVSHFGSKSIWEKVLTVLDVESSPAAKRTVANAIARNAHTIRSKPQLQICCERIVRLLKEKNDADTVGNLAGAIVALKKRGVDFDEKSVPKVALKRIRELESWDR